jgi:signal transduction histidine kinase
MMIDVNELNGTHAYVTRAGKEISRFFIDKDNHPEMVKFLLVLSLLILFNIRFQSRAGKIALLQWTVCVIIFLVFIFLNRFFLYQWPSASFFIAPLVALGLMVIFLLIINRIVMQRRAEKERMNLREKLSRDLHDELASTLGSASIYVQKISEMDSNADADFRRLSKKIAGLNESALHSVSDIIWMTSPRNDSLQNLVLKISDNMAELLPEKNIQYMPDFELPDDPVFLAENLRNDLLRIFKEALHNILKHSGASMVNFSVVLRKHSCVFTLTDDGIGMSNSGNQAKSSHGNGLINMKKRALENGIELVIDSSEGRGTQIRMAIRI